MHCLSSKSSDFCLGSLQTKQRHLLRPAARLLSSLSFYSFYKEETATLLPWRRNLTESLLARTGLSNASDNRIVKKAEDTGSVFLCRSDGIDEAIHSGLRPVRVAVLSSRGARWPPETANRCQTGTEHMTHHDAVVQRHYAMLGTIFRPKIVSRHTWTVLQQVRCTT